MDYQEILKQLQQVAERMKELSEAPDEWTPDQATEWDTLSARHDELIDAKAAADEKRRAEQVAKFRQRAAEPVAAAPRVHVAEGNRKAPTPRHIGRLRAFRNVDDAYDSGLWMRSKLFGDRKAGETLEQRNPDWLAEYRDLEESVNTSGGFLVPQPMSSAMYALFETSGVAVQLLDVVPMSSETLDFPKESTGHTVYYPGEGGTITESQQTYANVKLTAVKRAVLTQASRELLADSAINLADRVAIRMAHKMAVQADAEFILGDGTSTYGGEVGLASAVLAGSNTNADGNSWSAVTLANLNTVIGVVPSKYWTGEMCWLVRREFYEAHMKRLMYAAGGNTTENIVNGVPEARFLGYRVFFSDSMPADASGNVAAYFGNFMAAGYFGDRQRFELATSEHYAFNSDQITFRGIGRWDIALHECGTASAAGAVAKLTLT